jgi:hypothetical protein
MASEKMTVGTVGNPITHGLTTEIRACREVDQPMMIFGVPGAGKSQQVHQSIDPDDLMIDLRLNSLESIDMRGLPVIHKDEEGNPHEVQWVRPEFLPRDEGVKVGKKVYRKGVIFLDEINTAPPSTQNPALQLVLDRRIGKHELSRDWYICAAGNRAEDRAHVYPLSSALLDRFAIYDYTPNFQDWTTWAMKNDVHPDVIGYISFNPAGLLCPRQNEYSPSANPRSWCVVSKRLKVGQKAAHQIRACIGTQSTEFMAYLTVCASLPDIPKLIAGKTSFKEDRKQISVSYAVSNAVASHLLEHKNPEKVIDNCMSVISEVSPEPASLFFRRVMSSDNSKLLDIMFNSDAVTKWINTNQELLYGAISIS